MPTALMLAAAIATEVIATVALKASDGFSKPVPSAIVVTGYLLSFWLLALVLKQLSVGTTYAIWSAVGTAAVALIGIAIYGEAASALKLASLGLIVLGVIGLNAAGAH
jgi:small multidrug resistance pump